MRPSGEALGDLIEQTLHVPEAESEMPRILALSPPVQNDRGIFSSIKLLMVGI
jgi:hypothetical protein